MGLVGADVDQLRTLARTLSQAADQLEQATATVSNTLAATTWFGPDAERHRSGWHGDSVARVRAVAAALREAAHTVNRNADEQEQASSATGGSGPSGPGGGPAGRSGGIDILPDRFELIDPAVDIRDFLGSNALWPITWGTLLGPLDRWGALPLLDALGLAGDPDLTDQQRIVEAQNSATDLAGGLLKGGGGAVGYLSGVAVAQWGDVIAQTAEADFSPAAVSATVDYIAADPGEAFTAARDEVLRYVPKLFSNVVPW